MTAPQLPSSPPARPVSQTVAKSYTLTQDELEIIKAVGEEEGMLTDSGVVRLLIREGYKFRQIRRDAERALIAQSIHNEHTSK